MKKYILNKNVIILLFLFVIAFIITLNPIDTEQDDIIYREAFNNFSSFIVWAKEFILLWGGRVVALSLSTLFLNLNIGIFKLANATIIVILVYSIYKIIETLSDEAIKYKNIILISIMCSFLFINRNVIKYSVTWITGTFNYLWPCTAMIVAMIPFIKKLKNNPIKKVEYIVYFLSTLLASNIEQTGVVLFVFISIIIVIIKLNKMKIEKTLLANYIFCFIVLILSLMAPGNHVRYSAELLRWYQDFEMLSIFDKIIQGQSVLLDHLVNHSTVTIFIISILLMYISIKEKDKNRIKIAFIPLIYSLIRILPLNVLLSRIYSNDIISRIDKLFAFNTYGVKMICNPYIYIPIIIGTFVLIVIAILIFLSYKDVKKSIVYTLLYLAGICSTLSLSVSPTIFASSYRIFFVTDVLNVLLIASLTYQAIKYIKDNITVEVIYFISIIILAFINLLVYF